MANSPVLTDNVIPSFPQTQQPNVFSGDPDKNIPAGYTCIQDVITRASLVESQYANYPPELLLNIGQLRLILQNSGAEQDRVNLEDAVNKTLNSGCRITVSPQTGMAANGQNGYTQSGLTLPVQVSSLNQIYCLEDVIGSDVQ